MDDSFKKLTQLRANKSKYDSLINEEALPKEGVSHVWQDTRKPLTKEELDRKYASANSDQAFSARDTQNKLLGQELINKLPELGQGSGQEAFEQLVKRVYPGLPELSQSFGQGVKVESLPEQEYDDKYNHGGGFGAALFGSTGGLQTKDGISLREQGDRASDVGVMAHETSHLHDKAVQDFHKRNFKREMDQYNPNEMTGVSMGELADRFKDSDILKKVQSYISQKPAVAEHFNKPELGDVKIRNSEGLPKDLHGHQEEYNKKKSPLEMQREMSKDHHLDRNFPEDNLKKLLETGNPLDVVQTDPRKEALKKIIG